jgi:hypothetical protein
LIVATINRIDQRPTPVDARQDADKSILRRNALSLLPV